MQLDGWEMTRHAIQRALDMAVDAEEIRDAILSPARIDETPNRYPPERKLYTKGRLTLCVHVADKAVLTVMWNRWWSGNGARFDRDHDEEFWRD
jgi:hypothetical protein